MCINIAVDSPNVVNSRMPSGKTIYHQTQLFIGGLLLLAGIGQMSILHAAEQKAAVKLPCGAARLIVPAHVGSGSDIVARSLVKVLNADGQKPTVKVKNIPGEQGKIARTALRDASADGCHLGLFQQRLVSAFMTGQDDHNWLTKTPVALLTATPVVLVAPANGPLSNLADLIASLSADGAVRVGIENGSQTDFLLRMIEQETDGQFIRVNLSKGHQRLAAFNNKSVDLIVVSLAMATRLAKDQGANILATSSNMVAGLPSLITNGLEINFAIERGIYAPPKTQPEVTEWWAKRLDSAGQSNDFLEPLAEFETRRRFLAPDPFTRHLEDLTARWRQLARAGGIYRANE